MPLHLQPLRARRDDIPAIAAAMLLRHSGASGAVPIPTAAAVERLLGHDWPGNARELENVLLRAMLLRTGDRIEVCDLVVDAAAPAETRGVVTTLEHAAKAAEAKLIRAALDATGGHRLRAAEQLGISERTLRYRLAAMRVAAAA
jgi:two-component system response regulator FlrC